VALVPTLLAIGLGLALGLRWGGSASELLSWRPALWEALAAGVVLTVALDVLPVSGGWAATLSIAAMGLLLVFAVVNVRVGGMVLVVAGLGLDLLVAVLNWGTPVSVVALERAGILGPEDLGPGEQLVLTGGREVADGATLGLLGHVIPLPWGQVVSIGDVLVLVGLCLATASVVRRYEVRGAGRSPFHQASSRGRGGLGGPRDYRNALDALGRGPAPRRGPGLHPSRMPRAGSDGRRRRRPGTGPR
jgi:hypothetical protein